MKHSSLPGLLCLVLVLFISSLLSDGFIQAQAPELPRKLALLVGISRYDRGRQGLLDCNDLNGARDVQLLQKTLVERMGFKDEDVLVLMDEKATLNGIVASFQNHLIAQAKPGDVVFFHFSGHGQTMRDETGRKLDGLDECFVPSDYGVRGVKVVDNNPLHSTYNPRLAAFEIRRLLRGLCDRMRDGESGKVRGDILVTLDSCHSGTGTRGIMTVRGRDWDERCDGPKPKGRASSRGVDKKAEAIPEYVAIAACTSNQVAYEDPKSRLGVFTKHLISAFEDARPDSTYRDLFEKVQSEIVHLNLAKPQDPQLLGNPDKLILNGTLKPTTSYLLIEPLDEPDTVELPAGYLQGITEGSIFSLFEAGSDIDRQEKKIAELEVTAVDAVRSEARISKPIRMLSRDALLSARAVKLRHNYQSSLRVYGEDLPTELLDQLKKDRILAGGKDSYDIRISTRDGAFLLERADGSILPVEHVRHGDDDITIYEIEPSKDMGKKLSYALITEWRKRELLKMQNDAIRVDIMLITVDQDNRTLKKFVWENGRLRVSEKESEKLVPEKDSVPILQEGDVISYMVRNRSEEPVYINIIDVEGLKPQFPDPEYAETSEVKQKECDIVPADGEWHRIPINDVSVDSRSYYTWKVGQTQRRDFVKLIATYEQIDLAPLFDLSGGGERGKTPNPYDRYSFLASMSRSGTRGMNTGVFGTAELFFEARKK